MIENIFKTRFDGIPLFSVNCTLLETMLMQNKSFGKNILHGIRSRFGKLLKNPYRKVNVSPIRRIYYKHLSPGKLRKHRLFGKDIVYLSPTELLHGLKEIFIEEVYKQELPAKPYILDCGANIGLSVIYLKRLFPDAEIIAFEPDEQNFRLLEQNVRTFGYSDVVLKKEAVWVEDTILKFVSDGSMSSKIETGSNAQTVDVSASRLKGYLNRKVDFLKIDIEGAEFSVMMDIEDELKLVNNLFLEYHGTFEQNKELTQLIELITKCGFHYYIKEATGIYETPFARMKNPVISYDVQLNIFCFRLNILS
jgi:FkbM family methyltransferase